MKRLGVDVIPDAELGVMQGFMIEVIFGNEFKSAIEFARIRAQARLDYSYFNMDVGCGMVFLQKLWEQVGEDTPIMSIVITKASLVISQYNTKELEALLV